MKAAAEAGNADHVGSMHNGSVNRPRRIEPGPGQESVWDYPRPPRVEPTSKHVEVVFNDVVVADSRRAVRVLETAGAPTVYVPPEDVRMDLLSPSERAATVCEWKGLATYYDLTVSDRTAPEAAWTYLGPNRPYAEIAGWFCFYPGRVDACFLDGARVRPQPGKYYGGWVTGDVVGPFKGEPGTEAW
jgi:uncharacterized protein (DUF427 family)